MNALAIKAAEGYFELDEVNVNFTFSNPYFDLTGVPKGYTLPFKLPRSARNDTLMGHTARLDAGARKLEVEVWLDGLPFSRGLLSVNSVSESEYDVTFRTATLDVAGLLKEDYLDINYFESAAIPQTNLPEYWLRLVPTGTLGASTLSISIGGTTVSQSVSSVADLANFERLVSIARLQRVWHGPRRRAECLLNPLRGRAYGHFYALLRHPLGIVAQEVGRRYIFFYGLKAELNPPA